VCESPNDSMQRTALRASADARVSQAIQSSVIQSDGDDSDDELHCTHSNSDSVYSAHLVGSGRGRGDGWKPSGVRPTRRIGGTHS
jgi:hypothetical protein